MAKKKNIEFNDEYFLNLTMKYDERDDNIYPKWAVWCANSNGRYAIDGKDGYFYTRIKTDEEIKIEEKRFQFEEFLNKQNHRVDDWLEYEDFIKESFENNKNSLDFNLLTYSEWKSSLEESAE